MLYLEKGENPALAVADLLRVCADEISVNDPTAPDFQLVTPVYVRIGSVAYGVSAGDAEVHLTMRTFANEGLAALHQRILDVAGALADRDGLRLSWETVEEFFANMNAPDVTALVDRAARRAGLEVLSPEVGFRGGEDFGLFSQRFPCCMVLLGAGKDHHPLHNPNYDFPDELISTGVRLYEAVLDEVIGARSGSRTRTP